jgi:hypothetical protein
MAGELYDEIMKDNRIWAMWRAAYPALDPEPAEARFIEMMWPKLIERARATLASMLRDQEETPLRNEIARALIDDDQFRPMRAEAEARWRRKYGFGNGR